MAIWERHEKLCPKAKGPSFSSSLLDAIYRSIDETNASHRRRNTATKVEDDIESLRLLMIEKWIEKQYSMPRHFTSNSNSASGSSTDSSIFSSSETESRSSPKTSSSKPKNLSFVELFCRPIPEQQRPTAAAPRREALQSQDGNLRRLTVDLRSSSNNDVSDPSTAETSGEAATT